MAKSENQEKEPSPKGTEGFLMHLRQCKFQPVEEHPPGGRTKIRKLFKHGAYI
jgi:hypothetical protein